LAVRRRSHPNPQWQTGREGEYAVIVIRGQTPPRTNEEMQEIALGQVRRYLTQFTDVEVTSEVVARAVHQMSEDYLEGWDKRAAGLRITREQLLAYIGKARQSSGS
jgi:hypothetical protein